MNFCFFFYKLFAIFNSETKRSSTPYFDVFFKIIFGFRTEKDKANEYSSTGVY